MNNNTYNSNIPIQSNSSFEPANKTVSHESSTPFNSSAVKSSPPASKPNRFLLEVTMKYLLGLILLSVTAIVGFFIFFKPTETISVPNVIGKSYIDAVLLLQKREIYHTVTQQYTADPSDVGRVIQQYPAPGMAVRAKKIISLTVSQGTVISSVPDFVGFSFENVQNVLQDQFSGFQNLLKIRSINKVFDDLTPTAGIVIGQYPKAGTRITNVGTEIDLIISRGTQEGHIYDMIGLSFKDIFPFLQDTGMLFEFRFSNFSESMPSEINNYHLRSGIIQEQAPVAGVEYTEDTILRLGIRQFHEIQERDIPNQEIEPADLLEIRILEIPVPHRASRPIEIMKTQDDEILVLLSLSRYQDIITFPIEVIPGVSYEAIINDNVFWSYSIPKDDDKE